jgi:hypothetical protein
MLLVSAMWVGYLLIFTGATGNPVPPVPGAPPVAAAETGTAVPAAFLLR